MRGEEITSCKRHIASVSLTKWCIMILKKEKKKKKKEKAMSIVLQSLFHKFVDKGKQKDNTSNKENVSIYTKMLSICML